MITSSSFRAHSEPLFLSLQVSSVFDVYCFRLSIIVFRYENNLLPDCANSMFTKNFEMHWYCTRQSAWLHAPKGGKSAIQRTVRFRCVKISNYIWNIIDSNCSIPCFKYDLKLFLFQHGDFYYLHRCLLWCGMMLITRYLLIETGYFLKCFVFHCFAHMFCWVFFKCKW